MGAFPLRSLELVARRPHSADWHYPALDRPRALQVSRTHATGKKIHEHHNDQGCLTDTHKDRLNADILAFLEF
jgi:hypothetical protein